jgi:hypothetical protein
MTPEELDKARADEALRICEGRPLGLRFRELAIITARLARENWTPPPPVDPDVLAFREWVKKIRSGPAVILDSDIDAGEYDSRLEGHAFLAGARMAREQEQERAKVLVEPAEAIVNRAVRGTGSNGARWIHIVKAARRLEQGLTAYKAGRAAR